MTTSLEKKHEFNMTKSADAEINFHFFQASFYTPISIKVAPVNHVS